MYVRVPAKLLQTALRSALRLASRTTGAAAWKFDAGTLTIDWAGGSHGFGGEGAGQGTVRVNDADMRSLAKLPRRKGTIEVGFAEGWLRVGGSSVRAEGQPGDPNASDFVPQLLAVNPALSHLVRLEYQHTPETIAAAGLEAVAAKARKDRLERTERAAKALGPLGIPPAVLAAWIDGQLGGA